MKSVVNFSPKRNKHTSVDSLLCLLHTVSFYFILTPSCLSSSSVLACLYVETLSAPPPPSLSCGFIENSSQT